MPLALRTVRREVRRLGSTVAAAGHLVGDEAEGGRASRFDVLDPLPAAVGAARRAATQHRAMQDEAAVTAAVLCPADAAARTPLNAGATGTVSATNKHAATVRFTA